jgi:anti-sigma factor RsiW
MNCQETKNLWGPCQDGELDPAFCGEIGRHLESCPDCHQYYQAQQEFDQGLAAALQQGRESENLWRREEEVVRRAFQERARMDAEKRGHAGADIPDGRLRRTAWFEGVLQRWFFWLWPNPRFYAGMAVLWLALLATNWSIDNATRATARAVEISAAQKSMLAAQKREFKELLALLEVPPEPPKTSLPPRSQGPAGVKRPCAA